MNWTNFLSVIAWIMTIASAIGTWVSFIGWLYDARNASKITFALFALFTLCAATIGGMGWF